VTTKIVPGINGQCIHAEGRAPGDCDACWRDAENGSEIASLIARADDALVTALKATGQARTAIEELASNRVYDIELAEGTEGTDAEYELERAALSLRHVHRIIAHRKQILAEETGR
jgi:hypothetical protein